MYVLDHCSMDGQLGIDGENFAVPRLVPQFHELSRSDSLADELNTKPVEPIKVCLNSIKFMVE